MIRTVSGAVWPPWMVIQYRAIWSIWSSAVYLLEAPRTTSCALKSLAVRSTACSGLFVGTISGITFLPASSACETTAVINC